MPLHIAGVAQRLEEWGKQSLKALQDKGIL
jgi:hypothetical protein